MSGFTVTQGLPSLPGQRRRPGAGFGRALPRPFRAAIAGLAFALALRPGLAATVTTIHTRDPYSQRNLIATSPVTLLGGKIYGLGAVLNGDPFTYAYTLKQNNAYKRNPVGAYSDTDRLVALDGALYDISGQIVRLDPLLHVTKTYAFPAGMTGPGATLAALDGRLYGTITTTQDGAGAGAVFSLSPKTAQFALLHIQSLAEGNVLEAGITTDGTLLYGVSASDPPGFGTLFSVDPATGRETTIQRFTGRAPVAGIPCAVPLIVGGQAFGFTLDDAVGRYRLYRTDLTTGDTQLLHDFAEEGRGLAFTPDLISVNGLLYGTVGFSFRQPNGFIYTVDPQTGAFTIIYRFTNGADGAVPQGLTLDNGVIYGTTRGGLEGSAGGTVFTLTP